MVERNLKQEALEAKQEESNPVFIVRPSKLPDAVSAGFLTEHLPKTATAEQVKNARTKAIVNNIVASGTYEKAEPNKFNKDKKDFYIKDEDGTLYIINSTQSLEEQMELIAGEEGKVQLEVVYNGKITTKSGRSLHDFVVKVK